MCLSTPSYINILNILCVAIKLENDVDNKSLKMKKPWHKTRTYDRLVISSCENTFNISINTSRSRKRVSLSLFPFSLKLTLI